MKKKETKKNNKKATKTQKPATAQKQTKPTAKKQQNKSTTSATKKTVNKSATKKVTSGKPAPKKNASKPVTKKQPAQTKKPTAKQQNKPTATATKREIKVGDKIVGQENGAVGIVKTIRTDDNFGGVKPRTYAIIDIQNPKKGQCKSTVADITYLQQQEKRGGIKITTPRKTANKTATTAPNKTTKQPTTKQPAKNASNQKQATKQSQKQGEGEKPSHPQGEQPVATSKSELVTVNLKFHPDSNGGHHHIIVENLGDKHVSVGVTTSKKYDRKHNNVPLDHSPLSNGGKSYALRKGTVDKKKNYNSPKQGEITTEDAAKVKTIADKAKEKELKKDNN